MRVMSSLTMACGLSRSADTVSMPRALRRTTANAGSGAEVEDGLGESIEEIGPRGWRKIQATTVPGMRQAHRTHDVAHSAGRGPVTRETSGNGCGTPGNAWPRPKNRIRTTGRERNAPDPDGERFSGGGQPRAFDPGHHRGRSYVHPASTTKFCEVIILASSDARNSTMLARILGLEPALQALQLVQSRFALRRHPHLELALCHDPAGRDGIRPDVVRPQITGQSPGEAVNGRLARGIGRHAAGGRHPGDRAEVDDGATAQTLHLVHHRLGREELMAEIDGNPLIPEVDGHALDRMAIVARGVVDEDADIAAVRLHGVDGRAQELDPADVAGVKARGRPGARELLHQGTAGRLVDVHEADLGTLADKSFHDGRADS